MSESPSSPPRSPPPPSSCSPSFATSTGARAGTAVSAPAPTLLRGRLLPQVLERSNKILATLVIGLWLVVLGFVSGPMRWEFQHTYAHWIEGAGADLPSLTKSFALPVLGLGSSGAGAVLLRCLVWSVSWLLPLFLLVRVWRSASRLRLVEVVLMGGLGYGSAMALLTALLALGLWLPFSLL